MTRATLITIICFSLALILVIVFLLPNYNGTKIIADKIKLAQNELLAETKYFSEISSAAEKLKKYENQLAMIEAALPYGFVLPDLLNFLEKAASQSGLVLTGLTPIPPASSKEKPDIKESGLVLVVSGDYFAFKNFLSFLENSARFIEIENVSFSSLDEEKPIDFHLRLKVYSY